MWQCGRIREPRDSFDAAYYARFYGGSRAASARARTGRVARAVFSMAANLGLPIRTLIDVGAGCGYWRDWIAEHQSGVRYYGFDASAHACERYGHELIDLTSWTPARVGDLVVCQSVLQYIDDRGAEAAITALAHASRALLYLEVPTVRDLEHVLDRNNSDLDVHWRTGQWYRHRLEAGFAEIGGGIWLSRTCTIPMFEMEWRG